MTRLFLLAKIDFVGKNNMINTQINGCRVNIGFVLTNSPLLEGDYRYDKNKVKYRKKFVDNLYSIVILCEHSN